MSVTDGLVARIRTGVESGLLGFRCIVRVTGPDGSDTDLHGAWHQWEDQAEDQARHMSAYAREVLGATSTDRSPLTPSPDRP